MKVGIGDFWGYEICVYRAFFRVEIMVFGAKNGNNHHKICQKENKSLLLCYNIAK